MNIDDLHIEKVDIGNVNFGFLPNSNKLRFEIYDTNVKANADGNATIGWNDAINLALYPFNILNIKLQNDLEI